MRISLISSMLFYLAFLQGCGQVENQNHIDESTTNSENAAISNGPFHSLTGWDSTVPFYVSADAPDQVVEASMAAADSWNDSIGSVILVFKGVIDGKHGKSLYDSLNDTDTVIYYEEDWTNTTAKPDTTLATTVWENDRESDRIIRGDIILNAQIYSYKDSTADREESEAEDDLPLVDSETVILHELGHLLGLDHVDEEIDPFSVMHARTFIGPNMHSRHPSEDDRHHIQEIYN